MLGLKDTWLVFQTVLPIAELEIQSIFTYYQNLFLFFLYDGINFFKSKKSAY